MDLNCYKTKDISQGRADVYLDDTMVGFVEHSASKRGWWAYDAEGKRISDDINPKRSMAVREVAANDHRKFVADENRFQRGCAVETL